MSALEDIVRTHINFSVGFKNVAIIPLLDAALEFWILKHRGAFGILCGMKWETRWWDQQKGWLCDCIDRINRL